MSAVTHERPHVLHDFFLLAVCRGSPRGASIVAIFTGRTTDGAGKPT